MSIRGAFIEALGAAGAIGSVLFVGHLDLDSAQVTAAIVEERDAEVAAEPLLLRPVCPDQYVAMRGASERWRIRCVLASTEGSRAHE